MSGSIADAPSAGRDLPAGFEGFSVGVPVYNEEAAIAGPL